MNPKITTLIISMLLIGLISLSFVNFIGGGAENYNATFDDAELSAFDKTANISRNLQEVTEKTTSFSSESGAFDIVGILFQQAYQSTIIMGQSIGIFHSMSSAAFSHGVFGNLGASFQSILILIVTVLVVIGVFIGSMLKRDI